MKKLIYVLRWMNGDKKKQGMDRGNIYEFAKYIVDSIYRTLFRLT